jgi:hypothetical protein
VVLNLALMEAEQQVIHLDLLYPDGGLWREWDSATLYFPKDLLSMLHICFTFFVNNDYSSGHLLGGIFSCVRVV